MQKIIQIARLELAVLFYSPIAWLLLAIFVIQCGMTYTDMLYQMETQQQLGRQLPALTRALFSGDTGLLTAISKTLYLYIPLLTMGLMSREISSGSIKLLQSSPVNNLQIVLGKFTGMMGYGLLLCGVVLVYMLAALGSVESLDVGFVLGGTFGLFMLLSTYLSIGLFMSSLTGYPIVAAVSTLAALSALNYVGRIGQNIDGLREVTYWIALSGRMDGIINGLLTTREAIYFLAVTVFFLILAMLKLDAGRKRRPMAVRIGTYTALVAALVGVIFIASRPSFILYWDTTRVDDQTLSRKSQDLIARLNGPVRLTSYTNLLDRKVTYGEPKNRIPDRRQFERYQRFLPDMELVYVNYYDSVRYGLDTTKTLEAQARHVAKVRGFDFGKVLPPEAIRRAMDLRTEENGFVRMLEYQGKVTPLRMYDDMLQYPGESEVMAAFKRLVDGAATVWTLAANGERAIDRIDNGSYQVVTQGLSIRASLINQGFDTKPVALDTIGEIPTDIAVLMICDPITAYDAASLAKINRYIDRGGNLMLAGEPGKQAAINPITSRLGVELVPGTVMQESAYDEPDLVYGRFSRQADSLGFGFFDGARISMRGTAAIRVADTSGFRITPILVTDSVATWNKIGAFDLAVEKVKFNPVAERKERLTLLVAASRQVGGREQRIIVSGDADFMSNTEIQRPAAQNASFVINRLFRWFSDGAYPYSPNGDRATDRVVKVTRKGVNHQKIVFFAVLPLLIVSAGSITLVRRRRK